jgi:hypothetical protein
MLTADFGAFFQWLLTGILSGQIYDIYIVYIIYSGQTYCRHTYIYIYTFKLYHLFSISLCVWWYCYDIFISVEWRYGFVRIDSVYVWGPSSPARSLYSWQFQTLAKSRPKRGLLGVFRPGLVLDLVISADTWGIRRDWIYAYIHIQYNNIYKQINR